MYARFCALLVALLVLSGCGSGSSPTPPPAPPPTPPAATLTISVNPTAVEPGQSATLSWNAANATSCLASGDWTGTQPLIGSQNIVLSGAQSLTFNLSCKGANGNPSKTATLSVATGPNGCTVTPAVLPRTDRPMNRRRKLTHRASGF